LREALALAAASRRDGGASAQVGAGAMVRDALLDPPHTELTPSGMRRNRSYSKLSNVIETEAGSTQLQG
jgi:hypothetical protein